MKSLLTEAELSMLLMDDTTFLREPILQPEKIFVIGKIPISSALV